MTPRSFGPDIRAGWYKGELWWIDKDGKPVEKIGVDRECDVPGIHTPEAKAIVLAMPPEQQNAARWPQG